MTTQSCMFLMSLLFMGPSNHVLPRPKSIKLPLSKLVPETWRPPSHHAALTPARSASMTPRPEENTPQPKDRAVEGVAPGRSSTDSEIVSTHWSTLSVLNGKYIGLCFWPGVCSLLHTTQHRVLYYVHSGCQPNKSMQACIQNDPNNRIFNGY